MTTDVEENLRDEEGQSILEFVLLLPMMIGITILLINVNSAIQAGIVDQQYARAQLLFLTYNHSFYPKLPAQLQMVSKGNNQMIVGVSNKQAPTTEGGQYTPDATVQLVSRNKNVVQGSNDVGEVNFRSIVRIRNSLTLCSQNLFLMDSKGTVAPILPLSGPNNNIQASGPNILSQNSNLNGFCGSKMKYEQ